MGMPAPASSGAIDAHMPIGAPTTRGNDFDWLTMAAAGSCIVIGIPVGTGDACIVTAVATFDAATDWAVFLHAFDAFDFLDDDAAEAFEAALLPDNCIGGSLVLISVLGEGRIGRIAIGFGAIVRIRRLLAAEAAF